MMLGEESVFQKEQRANHACHIYTGQYLQQVSFVQLLYIQQYSQFALSCELWWCYFPVNQSKTTLLTQQ